MNLQNQIVDVMARTLFVCAYANHVEDGEYNDGNGAPCLGCNLFVGHAVGHPRPAGGENWEDYAPETTSEARDAALILLGKIEEKNRINIFALLAMAAKADGMDPYTDDFEYPEGYADEFGAMLAMQALGHGVGWTDNHEDFGYKSPDVEFMLDG